jgi:hypothetical protein
VLGSSLGRRRFDAILQPNIAFMIGKVTGCDPGKPNCTAYLYVAAFT